MRTKIIYEDREIIVCHKPAGIAVQSAGIDRVDMVSELKTYLKQDSEKVYLGVVHRLDQPVEGLIVFAKTQKAAASLSAQAAFGSSGQEENTKALLQQTGKAEKNRYEKKSMVKIYHAEVYGHLPKELGELRDYLVKDGKTNTSYVAKDPVQMNKDSNVSNRKNEKPKLAILKYRLLERRPETDVIEIQLLTGRHHQIRVQFSHAGYPLVGDMKYASEESAGYNQQNGIRNAALKAVRLEFMHPASGRWMVFSL